MSELREVFEMVTKQTEPDVDAWREQERRQRRTTRNRRLSALALAAAIGIVAVVVVIRAVDDGTGTQAGGQPAPTAAQPLPSQPGGTVEPGRYVFTSFDPVFDLSQRITMDVPEGYEGLDGGSVVYSGADETGVSISADVGDVYADPCRWEGTGLGRSAVSSADEVVAALASQKGLRVSAPTDITLDGFAGTYMERRVPARTDITDCDAGQFRVYQYTEGGWTVLTPGQLELLWVLDVDGVPLVIDAALEAGASAQVRAELQQMVESIRIEPIE
jgi:hypothetical protein